MTRTGSILILVVWTMVLLSLLVVSLGSRGVFALDVVDRLDKQLQGTYIAGGAAQQMLTRLAADPTPTVDGLGDPWITGPGFADQPFGEGAFSILRPARQGDAAPTFGTVDAESKLNLNTAPEEVLSALIQQEGKLREDAARRVAAAIADWRDEDKEERQDGAEDFYYLGLSDGYESKDGPFESVEELRLVKGVTPELFARVEPYLTVYGSGQVNINTASPVALRAFGLSPEGVKGIVIYRAGEDNTPGTADDRPFTAAAAIAQELASWVPAEDASRLSHFVQMNSFTAKSEDAQFTIEARAAGAAHPVVVDCVVNRSGAIELWAER